MGTSLLIYFERRKPAPVSGKVKLEIAVRTSLPSQCLVTSRKSTTALIVRRFSWTAMSDIGH